MAGARKLQAEIDRCLKKVAEGVEKFEETWKKVHNASNSNQKEKYEEDLKKEIKKLQRLRDQIKTWLASGEIKDKSTLMDNRKLIETQMERFKVVERETKTKAYSKEGLTNSARMDPAEREKWGMQQWLNQCIDTLNIQVDQFEAEIETLSAGGKKGKKKNDDAERREECQSWVEKHRDHIQKLETLLRMMDNDQVEVQQIKDIQEDIDNYIENSQEPDFFENEFIYEDIEGLEEMLLDLGAPELPEVSETTSSTGNSVSGSSPVPSNSNSGSNHNSVQSSNQDDLKKRHRSSQSDESKSAKKSGSSSSSSNGLVTGGSGHQTGPASPLPSAKSLSQAISQSPNNSSTSSGPSSGSALLAGLTNHLVSDPVASIRPTQPNFAAAAAATQNGHAPVESVKGEGQTTPPASPAHSLSSVSSLFPGPAKLSNNLSELSIGSNRPVTSLTDSPVSLASGLAPGSYPHPASGTLGQPQTNGGPAPGLGLQNNLQEHLQQQKSLPESLSSLKSLAQQALGQSSPPAGYLELGLSQDRKPSSGSQKNEAHIPPLLGVAPLGIVPLSKEHQFQYSMLEAASHHLPHPSDSERLRPYLPRNPCHTPPYYPQAPPPGSDTIDFFQRLSTETLFFIFYYMEGTKAQYLAAKALKKQSWRFHTKYMMWFQRHEEPKMINDEYEQGTYIYFDYEKWGQRKKEGFTFEYRFLEDRDLN